MKIKLILLLTLFVNTTTKAQKIINHQWHNYYIGGKKGYYVKTYQFTATTMTENQFGSGGQFDNNPMNIPIAEISINNNQERVITRYNDSSFYIIVFKNIDALQADVCLSSTEFNSIETAKAYEPSESDFQKWYTKEGYLLEEKKPAMPALSRSETITLTRFIVDTIKSSVANAKTENEKLSLALVIATLPSQYAVKKGFHAYKSIPVVKKAMNKYAKDPAIQKMMKEMNDIENVNLK